jgi:hypothetical protein
VERKNPRERAVVNAVFGETVPESSSDDRDPDVGEDHSERDRWLRDNVPPHHG